MHFSHFFDFLIFLNMAARGRRNNNNFLRETNANLT
jgi:hypothetical protein